MLKYLRENGFPYDLVFLTNEFSCRDNTETEWVTEVFCDDKKIDEFITEKYPSIERKFYARAFFKSLEIKGDNK